MFAFVPTVIVSGLVSPLAPPVHPAKSNPSSGTASIVNVDPSSYSPPEVDTVPPSCASTETKKVAGPESFLQAMKSIKNDRATRLKLLIIV